MMKSEKKKRQHWVPQSYLKSFAVDSAGRKIWTLRKDQGDPLLRPIRKVAIKHHLYSPIGPLGRDHTLEDKLSLLENFFGSGPWKSICTGYVDLCNPTMRKMVSLLAAVMYLRNPKRLHETEIMHSQLVELISSDPALPDSFEIGGREVRLDTDSWPAYRDAGANDIKRMWIGSVGYAGWLAEILMDMRWAVMVSNSPVFITTDNPVIALDRELRFRGFKNPETIVAFPLSPTRLLWMDHRHSESDGQYYATADGGAGMNGLLWHYAIRDMFSQRYPDCVCAEIVGNAEQMGFA